MAAEYRFPVESLQPKLVRPNRNDPNHAGLHEIYFVVAPGTRVVSAREGRVIIPSKLDDRVSASNLVVEHKDGTVASYNCLEPTTIAAKHGQEVSKGYLLGYVMNRPDHEAHLIFNLLTREGGSLKTANPRFEEIDKLGEMLLAAWEKLSKENSQDNIGSFRHAFSIAYRAAGFKRSIVNIPVGGQSSSEAIYEKPKHDSVTYIIKQGSISKADYSYHYADLQLKDSVPFLKRYIRLRNASFFRDLNTESLLKKHNAASGAKALEKLIEEMQ